MIFIIFGIIIGAIFAIWTLNDYQEQLGAGWFPWPFREVKKKKL